jgi:queuosine precursor transporter
VERPKTDAGPVSVPISGAARKSYRYYDFVMAAFVTVLICSNLIGPAKIVQLDGWPAFGAGVLFFPISYVFGDILTEVYGYARARRVIWAGFAGLAFASLMAAVVVALPPAPFWENQKAYEIAFGQAPRIAAASMLAYFCGEFVNSFVLAKMKILTAGRWLWTRTIGSTIVGEALDSALFYPLAFYGSGIVPNDKLPAIMLAQFVLKVSVEVVFTPVTYKAVGALKRAESEDYYDRDTNFTPFTLKT